jgi:hypothetical protein
MISMCASPAPSSSKFFVRRFLLTFTGSGQVATLFISSGGSMKRDERRRQFCGNWLSHWNLCGDRLQLR